MIATLRLLRDAYMAFAQDDGSALAGHIAFSALLGLFPFVILATNMTAFALGADGTQQAVQALFDFAPPHIAQTLEPVLRDVLAGAGGGLLTVSAVAALWFSSNAVEAIRTGFDRAYQEVEPHGLIAGRMIAFLVVIVGVIVAMTLGTTIVIAPLVIGVVESFGGFYVPGWVGVLRYGVGIAVFVAFLLFLHRVLPGHSHPLSMLWPGVLTTAGIWLAAATGFSIYLGYTPTYATTYGTLAGVVITLVFFYITGMAIIFGAEVNAVLNRRR